jgi:hypothetical protein
VGSNGTGGSGTFALDGWAGWLLAGPPPSSTPEEGRPTGLLLPAIRLVAASWDIREGLDPSSRDNAESLPKIAKFSCANALFISLSPFTDFEYVYVNPSGALSLCRAEATKFRASMMAVSWACSRSERAAGGASGLARGKPRL